MAGKLIGQSDEQATINIKPILTLMSSGNTYPQRVCVRLILYIAGPSVQGLPDFLLGFFKHCLSIITVSYACNRASWLRREHTRYGTFAGKLTGMHENTVSVTVGEVPSAEAVCACALTTGNLLQVPSTEEKIFRFAAKTLSAGAIVLVSVSTGHGRSVKVTVNCEKIVIGSMLTKDIQSAVSDSWLAGRL